MKSAFDTSDVVIATTAAGAIPYYSELQTVDMLGMNDRWVARNGYRIREARSNKPGHRRMSPLSYLISQDVNLLIAHPQVTSETSRSQTHPQDRLAKFLPEREWSQIPADAQFLELPVGGTYSLLIIYLIKHPDVEQLIRRKNLKTWPIMTAPPS